MTVLSTAVTELEHDVRTLRRLADKDEHSPLSFWDQVTVYRAIQECWRHQRQITRSLLKKARQAARGGAGYLPTGKPTGRPRTYTQDQEEALWDALSSTPKSVRKLSAETGVPRSSVHRFLHEYQADFELTKGGWVTK